MKLSDASMGPFVSPLRQLAREFVAVAGAGVQASLVRLERCDRFGGSWGCEFHCHFGEATAILDLSHAVAVALLDRVLVGQATPAPQTRLTELGAHLLEPLLEEWLGKALGRGVRVGPPATEPVAEEWMDVGLEVGIDGHTGDCMVWLPRAAWPQAVPSRVGGTLPEWLGRRAVAVEALVGHAHLTVHDLRSLQAGDLVPLDREPGEPWRVGAANGPIGAGHPCEAADGFLALLLTDLEEGLL